MLQRHFNTLALAGGARVFLPLCGKTRDIAWLLSRGYCVAGVELAGTAIQQLFSELGVVPKIDLADTLTRYSVENLAIHVVTFLRCPATRSVPLMRSMTERHWSRYPPNCAKATPGT